MPTPLPTRAEEGLQKRRATDGARADEKREREIARLIEPGLLANAWRPDFDEFCRRRLWDEHNHGRRVRMLIGEWSAKPEDLVLDLGTGRGGFAVALAQQGFPVVALDLRRRNARIARLRGRRYGLDLPAIRGRGEALPFTDAAFAAVVCRDVLEHCQRPAQLLAEIRRVLRPGGSCFLTVINRWCWTDPHYHLPGLAFLPRWLAERCIALANRTKDSAGDNQRLSDMHYYSYRGFHRLAHHLGFAVRDLNNERLERYRFSGSDNLWRWLRQRALRPLSLQSNHFELLLRKPGMAK